MKAEVLATGDEIRSGSLADTNSAHISEKLEQAGIEVTRHQCVGDDLAIMKAAIKEISARADICVVTGGLGPTTDDVTTEAAAQAVGLKLFLDKTSLEEIRKRFASFSRPMSPSNEKQAMFPEGAGILKNPAGTAPGFSIYINKCKFYFMPGVPHEMKKMLSDHVLPDILKLTGNEKQFSMVRTISTFGLGESVVGEKVADVISEFPNIKLGLRATFPEILVKLYIRGTDENEMKLILNDAVTWIQHRLGDHVFSNNGLSIEQAIGDMLKEKRKTLSIAESCTGGLISNMITNVPGSSEYFLFSGITYTNESKMKILGVKSETLEKFGAVSEETAREMAEGIRKNSGSDYGLSTTGIAGPDGGSPEKPVGTVCIGVSTPERTYSKKVTMLFRRTDSDAGNRTMNKKWFAFSALDMLRRELQGLSQN